MINLDIPPHYILGPVVQVDSNKTRTHLSIKEIILNFSNHISQINWESFFRCTSNPAKSCFSLISIVNDIFRHGLLSSRLLPIFLGVIPKFLSWTLVAYLF